MMTSALIVVTSLVVAACSALPDTDEVRWHPHRHRSPYIVHDYSSHPCRRPCDGRPRVCKYYFLAEHYNTMSAQCGDCPRNVSDCAPAQCVPGTGKMAGILTINRMMPGPVIDVCQNDTIEVVVYNFMALGEGLSIHWHGLRQMGTPHMDGTNLVTQCPIPSWGKMKYRFAAMDAGTYYWHSHSSMQRSEGLFGGLVVRHQPHLDPHAHLYDVDSSHHWVFISDIVDKPIMEIFVRDYFDDVRALPNGFLINGVGTLKGGPAMPKPVFRVQQGLRYRFRVVLNGILNCPVYISVDGHELQVIASDGQDVEPVMVDRFMIYSGERWDFVLHANQPAGNFWVRFKTRGRGMELKLVQSGVLRYEGAAEEEPAGEVTYRNTPEDGRVLNGIKAPTPKDKKKNTTNIQVVDLKALEPTADEDLMTREPDLQYYITMGAAEIIDPRFQQSKDDVRVRPLNPQLNYISSLFPPNPPLTEYKHIPGDMFCNNLTMGVDCSVEMCNCVHNLRYKLGDIIELVMVNFKEGPSHPMHIHGHQYAVVAQKFFGRNLTVEEVKAMDARGEIPRVRSPQAPRKDTLAVRMQSVVIIRFRADNPGFWLFHCHIEFHSEVGMHLLLQEGNLEDMPAAPDGFPRCGHWRSFNDDEDPDYPDEYENAESQHTAQSGEDGGVTVEASRDVGNSTLKATPVEKDVSFSDAKSIVSSSTSTETQINDVETSSPLGNSSSTYPPDDGTDHKTDEEAYGISIASQVFLVVGLVVVVSIFGYAVYRNQVTHRYSRVYRPLSQVNSNYRAI